MIELNGIKLKNRFVVASGALEYGRGWPWERPLIKLRLIDPKIFGAVVTKTLTLEPNTGNYIDPFEFERRPMLSHLYHSIIQREPRIQGIVRRVPNGWINRMGLWNVGIDYWIREIYPYIKELPLVVSIGGFEKKEYVELIKKLNCLDILAIEMNISCPNVKNPFMLDLKSEYERFFISCKNNSEHPLILKVGVGQQRIAEIAQKRGINAISLINSMRIFGEGWSGRGIKSTALRTISEIRGKIDIPIIGGGGVYSWSDCQEFFRAGADAVSFGSVHFLQPWKPTAIVRRHQNDD